MTPVALLVLAWVDLFDGTSTAGWRTPKTEQFPSGCWAIEDGALRTTLARMYKADLWTTATYENFELEFEFKIAPGSNGGIKYLVQEGRASTNERGTVEYTRGLEFQILDDAALDEGKNPKTRTGAMYTVMPSVDPPDTPPGVFHRGRIVVDGNRIEHYLNGRLVLRVTLGSPEMEAGWDGARTDIRGMRALAHRRGPIVITHHRTPVWYRRIRIRELPSITAPR